MLWARISNFGRGTLTGNTRSRPISSGSNTRSSHPGGSDPVGEKEHEPFQFTFNGFLKGDFQGSRVTARPSRPRRLRQDRCRGGVRATPTNLQKSITIVRGRRNPMPKLFTTIVPPSLKAVSEAFQFAPAVRIGDQI